MMSGEVAKYMNRLLSIDADLIKNTHSVQEDYFDEVFDGRTFDNKTLGFLLKPAKVG